MRRPLLRLEHHAPRRSVYNVGVSGVVKSGETLHAHLNRAKDALDLTDNGGDMPAATPRGQQ